MTKQELLAIKALPEDYLRDGTQVVTYNQWVIAINGQIPLPPIKFDGASWTPISFSEVPTPTQRGRRW